MPEVGPSVRRQVRARADERCEYCLKPDASTLLPFHIDHIVAAKHLGSSKIDNLAWCCSICNGFKGSDVGSVDNTSGKYVRLFNPRTDLWWDHFRLDSDAVIAPVTEVGRVTVALLRLNRHERVLERLNLLRAGI